MANINWDKCFEDTKELGSKIKADLTERIKGIDKKMIIQCEIFNYPPRIYVDWNATDMLSHAINNAEFISPKKVEKIKEMIYNLCDQYKVGRLSYGDDPSYACSYKKKGAKTSKNKAVCCLIFPDFSKYQKKIEHHNGQLFS